MKTIQEVLNEYRVELKSTNRHVTVYTCKRLSQKNKLIIPVTSLNASCTISLLKEGK
jgi:hypothetical protein